MSTYQHIDVSATMERTLNNEKIAREWYQLLSEEINTTRLLILEAWPKKNYKKIDDVIHKMHGACCYCAAPKLKDISALCESKLKDGSADAIIEQSDIDQIIAEMDLVNKDIQQFLEQQVVVDD